MPQILNIKDDFKFKLMSLHFKNTTPLRILLFPANINTHLLTFHLQMKQFSVFVDII